MPQIDIQGFDELNDAFTRMSDIPESVMADALTSMAEVASKAIKNKGESMGVRDPESSVHILDKLKINKFKKDSSGGHVDITFSGTRSRGNKRVRNAEIAFVNEYGTRKQRARPFIGTALAEQESRIVDAGISELGNWLEHEFEK